MCAENTANLILNRVSREGSVQSFEPDGGGFLLTEWINFKFGAEGLRHCLHAMLAHQSACVFFLFSIFGIGFSFRRAPSAVAVVTAIVHVPAEHVPKFPPGQESATAQDARSQLPRPRAARQVEFFLMQDAKMPQHNFHPGDALPCAPNVPPLSAIRAPRTGKAIVRPKCHDAAAENVHGRGLATRG